MEKRLLIKTRNKSRMDRLSVKYTEGKKPQTNRFEYTLEGGIQKISIFTPPFGHRV